MKKRIVLVVILISVICLATIALLNKTIIEQNGREFLKNYFKIEKKAENIIVELPEPSKDIKDSETADQTGIKIWNGNDRPIAFMIDNNKNAQPQASLNLTYMVYEIIVEGGETRLMALFKGVTADEVGPIRSARHYFLDYAMENDAIYAHLGMSPQAQSDFSIFNINNINGQVYDTGKSRTKKSLYWREKHKKAPHNAYTNTESILNIAESKGYSRTSNKKSILNYVTEDIYLEQEDAIIANSVIIPYTSSHKVEYRYNEDSKRYVRYSKNKKITDETTGEDVTTKNIIITFAENYTLDDGENKGRQNVVTVGELDGYYITNGKAIKIKCIKKSRSEQTTYVDLKGNEIEINDGNTWVNICPFGANVTFSE